MIAESVARLARELGFELADAEPDELLRAAEAIGPALASMPARADDGWEPLPMRPDPPASPDERRAAIARMLAWARVGGASWDGIEVHVEASGNASIRASRALAAGETILSVPRTLMIIDTTRDALAAWLPVQARAPASRWRAYLETLPVRFAELPMFRSAEDLAALAGTSAHALAADAARDVRTSYAALPEDQRAVLSLAEFAWGCAAVKSRGFHAPGSVEHRIALIPVVDLFDHALGDTTWTFDPTDGNFVLATERAFAAGDPVHFTYGDHGNTQLLVHYGFTEPNNAAAEAALLVAHAEDPVTAVAAHLLWQLPLDAPARVRVGSVLDHRFLHALSVARLHAAGPALRAQALEIGLGPHAEIPWLGAELEATAFGVIADAARRALAELDAHASPAGSDAALVRAHERAVLAQVLDVATMVLPHLHAPRRAVPDDAPPLLRQYLHAVADVLR